MAENVDRSRLRIRTHESTNAADHPKIQRLGTSGINRILHALQPKHGHLPHRKL